jgi:DNA polymerase-1
MGILATWSGLKGEKIIVSIDKDMKTIPGLYLRELGDDVIEITKS